jgi:PAS domain S-box-containing protein
MIQVARVNLENEMDLILAHKRTMKLAELCGLSLTTQTVLATAVSEIARCAMLNGKHSYLTLGITSPSVNKKQISAVVWETVDACYDSEAITFAKRLIDEVQCHRNSDSANVHIHLNHHIKFSGLITDIKIQSFVDYFKTEPPLSPYDEIRKKNIQLMELTDRLRESEKQYQLLTDTLPLMMFSINKNGEITYTNQGLKDYLGEITVSFSRLSWQAVVHPDDYPLISREWSNSLRTNSRLHAQCRLRNKVTNVFLWHLISVVPVKNAQDLTTHWIGFFVDIHSQKMIEETLKDNAELKQTQKQLQEYQTRLEDKIAELNISNHELEQFAYIASHDLQEPLRKIITFSSLISDRLTTMDTETKMYFGKIITSTKRMSSLISDVLDYSRIARTVNEFHDVDLNNVMEVVKTDFEVLIQQKKAVLECSDLPVVNGNALQLNQLFSNLISNSIKFSEKTPVIKIRSRKLLQHEVSSLSLLDAALSYCEIAFIDNGIGFEQQYADQIFAIFQRLNGQSAYGGTGIGLAICKKIAENHQGLIAAEAVPDEGATFKVYLPLKTPVAVL